MSLPYIILFFPAGLNTLSRINIIYFHFWHVRRIKKRSRAEKHGPEGFLNTGTV